eukprot:325880-Chlamydomonas_euryale.AAC.11
MHKDKRYAGSETRRHRAWSSSMVQHAYPRPHGPHLSGPVVQETSAFEIRTSVDPESEPGIPTQQCNSYKRILHFEHADSNA